MQKGKIKIPLKWIITVVVLILTVLIIILTTSQKSKVAFYKLKPNDLHYTILSNCIIDYPDPLDVTSTDDGEVLTIYTKEGKILNKGQKILDLIHIMKTET